MSRNVFIVLRRGLAAGGESDYSSTNFFCIGAFFFRVGKNSTTDQIDQISLDKYGECSPIIMEQWPYGKPPSGPHPQGQGPRRYKALPKIEKQRRVLQQM